MNAKSNPAFFKLAGQEGAVEVKHVPYTRFPSFNFFNTLISLTNDVKDLLVVKESY